MTDPRGGPSKDVLVAGGGEMFVPLFFSFGLILFRPFSVRLTMATTETADYTVPQISQQFQPMQLETQDEPDASQQTLALEGQPPAPASPFEALEIRLKDNPYDSSAWQDLVNLAEDSGDFARLTNAYEALLKVYPNLVSPAVLLSFSMYYIL